MTAARLGLSLLLSTLAFGAGCFGGGDDTPGDAGTDADWPMTHEGTWRQAFDTSEASALFGVWGSGPDDVFIVGGSDEQAEIYHYDGNDWSPMVAPDVRALIWVYGFGPRDVYAVGLGGAVVHYDGSDWSVLDSGTDQDLWGIFGFDDSEMWIVGGDPLGDAPALLRYDGESFEQITLSSDQNARDAKALFKVWGIDDVVFAVGQRGQVLRRVGDGDWENSSAGAEANQDWVSLWGTGLDNIVLVGGRSNARIATYDGDEGWTTRPEPGLGGINGVSVREPHEAILGGVEGFVGRYDIHRDEIIRESQDVTDLDVHAVWGDGEGTFYGVAGDFLPPYEGAALVRTVE